MRGLGRLRRSPVVFRALAGSRSPWQDTWLALRMAGWAVVLPALKHVVPVGVLARIMWKGEGDAKRRDPVREAQVVRLAGWLSRGTNLTKRGACLQRSLLAYRYLSELGADPRLVLAVGKTDGALRGHAWVIVDGHAVGERAEMPESFVPITSFGARGRILAA